MEASPEPVNPEQIREILEKKLAVENGEDWETMFEEIAFQNEDYHYTSPGPSDSGHKYIAAGPVNAPEDGIQVYTSFYNGFAVGAMARSGMVP